jgi:hypothetical protein
MPYDPRQMILTAAERQKLWEWCPDFICNSAGELRK